MDVLAEDCQHVVRDHSQVFFQREVARIQKVNLSLWNISLEGRGAATGSPLTHVRGSETQYIYRAATVRERCFEARRVQSDACCC